MKELYPKITEEIISFLWKRSKFDLTDLVTSEGSPIVIQHNGFLNTNQGPDYEDARIIIGDQEWRGHVELHVKSSDWNRHGHQYDSKYDNVILHVVYEEDEKIKNSKGGQIPCLELKGRIPRASIDAFGAFLNQEDWLLCRAHHSKISSFTWRSWLDRMLVERLESRARTQESYFQEVNGDWLHFFIVLLFRSFGTSVNKENFTELAKNISPKILLKKKDNLVELEAYLLGAAGMLDLPSTEPYTHDLRMYWENQK